MADSSRKPGDWGQEQYTVEEAALVLEKLSPGRYEFHVVDGKKVKISREQRRWIQREEVGL